MITLHTYINNVTETSVLTAAVHSVVRRCVRLAHQAKALIIIANCSLLITHLVACSTIDDDLSDCGTGYQLDYQLQLVTNMTTELSTQLTTSTDVKLASAVRSHLSRIFTDMAHDVDLSFYDTEGDSLRLQHDEHIMDDSLASYTLYLPMRRYMHLAVANLIDNPMVSLANDEYCHQSVLQQPETDTISSHTTGIFTARLPMEVLEGVNQNFKVHLYMANCASTLVIDTIGSGVRDVKVYVKGFATGFNIADSTYQFSQQSPVVRPDIVNVENTGDISFCSVTFPSREVTTTRGIIETTEPFVAPTSENSLWEYHVYVTTKEGSITETKLYVNKPLRAGQLKVLKAKAIGNGSVTTTDQTVAVSVTLNWDDGGQYEPTL